MSAHRFEVRVYYEDTDFSGNVYHAAYLHFLERGRTEFLRAQGIHHSELAKEGIAFAVRRMEIDFTGAAHIDDLLAIHTEVAPVTGARLALEQTVFRDERVLITAKVLVVTIARCRAVRMPKAIVERFGKAQRAA